MYAVSAIFIRHLAMLRRYPVMAFILLVVSGIIIYTYYENNDMFHGAAYLVAMWLCAYVVDLWMYFLPNRSEPVMVKKPKQESFVFLVFTALGVLFLLFRFVFIKDWPALPGIYKLSIMPLMLFVFPIALTIYFLFKRYSLRQLGLRFDRNLLLALPVTCITGATTWLVAPQNIHFTQAIRELGVGETLFEGFISAALCEEFMRYIGQTRLSRFFNNVAWAWFLTVLIWALMHVPKWYSESDGEWSGPLSGAVRIIPLGLMWSYMIHRTRSIMPSLLVHATNLWGLQNP